MIERYRVCASPYLYIHLPEEWKCPACGHGRDVHIQVNGHIMCTHSDCTED